VSKEWIPDPRSWIALEGKHAMRLIEAMLSRSAHYGHVSDVLFRLLFCLIFIVDGLGHFFRTA
jgi:hypothetical protein